MNINYVYAIINMCRDRMSHAHACMHIFIRKYIQPGYIDIDCII